jgi:hypothetical protein
MQQITTDGENVQFDLYRQPGNSEDEGFETEPFERVPADRSNTWIYFPADVGHYKHHVSISHQGNKLPTRIPSRKWI